MLDECSSLAYLSATTTYASLNGCSARAGSSAQESGPGQEYANLRSHVTPQCASTQLLRGRAQCTLKRQKPHRGGAPNSSGENWVPIHRRAAEVLHHSIQRGRLLVPVVRGVVSAPPQHEAQDGEARHGEPSADHRSEFPEGHSGQSSSVAAHPPNPAHVRFFLRARGIPDPQSGRIPEDLMPRWWGAGLETAKSHHCGGKRHQPGSGWEDGALPDPRPLKPPMAERRSSTTQRGYGHRHQEAPRLLEPVVRSGRATCARCDGPILPSQAWGSGHTDHDRSRYSGPEHRRSSSGYHAAPGRRARRGLPRTRDLADETGQRFLAPCTPGRVLGLFHWPFTAQDGEGVGDRPGAP